MSVLGLYSGAGGLDYGFHVHPKFRVSRSYDFMPEAVDAYNLNFPRTCRHGDVSQLLDPSFDLGFKPNVIIGGPPCQDFSPIGKMKATERADQTRVFQKIITKYRPQFFVMENTSFITSIGKSFLDEITTKLKKTGYGLTARVIKLSDYGVPQTRKRFFMIGKLGAKDGWADNALDKYIRPVKSVAEYCRKNSIPLKHKFIYNHPRNIRTRGVFTTLELYPTIRTIIRNMPSTYVFREADATRDPKAVFCPTWKFLACLQTFPVGYKFLPVKNESSQNGKNSTLVGNAVPPMFSTVLAKVIASAC